jgi:hypothetical protein
VWAFIDDKFTWDTAANLSGSVAHGNDPCGAISVFGTVPAECELLDGVLLAATKSRLSAAMFGSAGWNEGRRLYRRASLDADILGRRLAAAAATELREMWRASQRGPRN